MTILLYIQILIVVLDNNIKYDSSDAVKYIITNNTTYIDNIEITFTDPTLFEVLITQCDIIKNFNSTGTIKMWYKPFSILGHIFNMSRFKLENNDFPIFDSVNSTVTFTRIFIPNFTELYNKPYLLDNSAF